MFFPKKLLLSALLLSLMTLGTVALGQQTTTTQPGTTSQQPARSMQMRRAFRRRAGFRALRQLNLTDQQKQQARAIVQNGMQNNKAQRQELLGLTRQWRQGTLSPDGLARANVLHKQLQDARKATRAQLIAMLTPEQRAKLEEMIKARQANRELRLRNQLPN